MLKQTVYISRCTPDGLSGGAITDILAVSHHLNPGWGVTGGLAASDGRFLQVLEGPATAVDALLMRLYRDPRHTELTVLSTRSIATRRFSDWAMAHPRFLQADAQKISRVFHDPYADPDVICGLMLSALAPLPRPAAA